MIDIKIGDEVFIQNFESKKLTIEDFDKHHATCIYLDRNDEFKKISLKRSLLVKSSFLSAKSAVEEKKKNKK
jgi:hypothetical protein